MCPIVPTFTCVLFRTNFSFAMTVSPRFSERSSEYLLGALHLRDDLFLDRGGDGGVMREVQRGGGAALCHRPQVRDVAEHRRERNLGVDHLRVSALTHPE